MFRTTRSVSLGPGLVVGVLVVVERDVVGSGACVVGRVVVGLTVGLVVGCPDGSVDGSVVGLYDDVVVGSAYDGSPLCFRIDEASFSPITPITTTPRTTNSAITPPRPFFGGRGPPGGAPAPQPNCG